MKIHFWYCEGLGLWRWTLSVSGIQESNSTRDLNVALATLKSTTAKHAITLPNVPAKEFAYSCSLG
jgi:hypothetical protein